MGLLDRWKKKEEAERLEKKTEPKAETVSEDKPVAKVEKKPATAKAKKTSTKKVAAKPVEEKAEVVATTDTKKVKKIDSAILLRALVTEKSAINQSQNKYSFIVSRGTNKSEIKKAVLAVYNVLPVSVNVINVQGKAMRFGKSAGKRSDFKKAVVTLPKGKTIVIHEGV